MAVMNMAKLSLIRMPTLDALNCALMVVAGQTLHNPNNVLLPPPPPQTHAVYYSLQVPSLLLLAPAV